MYGATTVEGIWFAVYSPPSEGLPFLSVMHLPDGKISAVACATREEAESATSTILVSSNAPRP